MKTPERIVDLHTHLFNARYLPLAAIFKDALHGRHALLAGLVAQLLEEITGSSFPYAPLDSPPAGLSQSSDSDFALEQIWRIVRFELFLSTHSSSLLQSCFDSSEITELDPKSRDCLYSSKLHQIIVKLSMLPELSIPLPPDDCSSSDYSGWAKYIVTDSISLLVQAMDPSNLGDAYASYLDFFLLMLRSEEDLVKSLFSSYHLENSSFVIVHHMMDLEKAYKPSSPPYYPFHPVQRQRMQSLQRAQPGKIFGFSAFDPRWNEDWKVYAQEALEMGFLGFKFYPSLGYKPSGNTDSDNTDPKINQNVIDSFYDFCVSKDVPIFAHCTPKGFQTSRINGNFAHPKYWKDVLSNPRWSKLRLCLGHAGGGDIESGGIHSRGWVAQTNSEWNDENNYARICVELCAQYPNVYLDFGHLLEIFDPAQTEIIIRNFNRAMDSTRESLYQFSNKFAYGSDWHMPLMLDRTCKYYQLLLDIMNSEGMTPYVDNFFWRNACSFLKLSM